VRPLFDGFDGSAVSGSFSTAELRRPFHDGRLFVFPAYGETTARSDRHADIPMKYHRRFALLATFSLASVFAQETAPKTKTPVKKAPDPAYAQIVDVAGLPRVLMLGDSISIGYMLPVRARLAGKANVHRPAENCGETARGLKSLDQWLGDGKWDVIHFNFGLHDVKYLDAAGKYVPPDQGKQVASVADYEKNLRGIVARLKQTGAKLIFATTTPVPGGSQGRVEHDEVRYNETAVRVMKETGVAVDDLHAFVAARQAKIQLPKNVHFTKDGYEQLADTVVASIAPLLPVAK
jgi:acyl-CoA thioesterase-1